MNIRLKDIEIGDVYYVQFNHAHFYPCVVVNKRIELGQSIFDASTIFIDIKFFSELNEIITISGYENEDLKTRRFTMAIKIS